MKQHLLVALWKFPEMKEQLFRWFLPAKFRLAERAAGGGKRGSALALSSLCTPLTVKGVKLLRCCCLEMTWQALAEPWLIKFGSF